MSLVRRIISRCVKCSSLKVKDLKPGDIFSYPGDKDYFYNVKRVTRPYGGVEYGVETDNGYLSLLGDEDIEIIDRGEYIKKKYGILGVVDEMASIIFLFELLERHGGNAHIEVVNLDDEKVIIVTKSKLSPNAIKEFMGWYK